MQIRIDKIKTTEPTSPIELDLTGYKYTSFEAFRNKIEKVRKSRPLEAKEIEQIIAVVEGFGADGKVKAKLKKNRDWKLFDNGNAWRYLKSVIGRIVLKICMIKLRYGTDGTTIGGCRASLSIH